MRALETNAAREKMDLLDGKKAVGLQMGIYIKVQLRWDLRNIQSSPSSQRVYSDLWCGLLGGFFTVSEVEYDSATLVYCCQSRLATNPTGC